MTMAETHSLFRKIPPWTVVCKILSTLNISTSFPTTFQQMDIDCTYSIDAVSELEPYYIPCKAVRFLSSTNPKRWITIFRHILTPYGYSIQSKETTRNGKKAIFYTIIYSVQTDIQLKEPINVDFS
jgi:hypothetical protein